MTGFLSKPYPGGNESIFLDRRAATAIRSNDGQQTAVDQEGDATHVARHVRSEPNDRVRDLRWLSESAQWSTFPKAFRGFGYPRSRSQEMRIDRARADRVHPDSVRTEGIRQSLGHQYN